MKARFLSTKGPYQEARIEIEDQEYCVIDEMTVDERMMSAIGHVIEFEFSNEIDKSESWESMFSRNGENKKCLEQITGSSYRAFGQVIDINPVRIDCGVLVQESVLHSNDSKIIGEYISFTIRRLGGYGQAI